jgi:hypothetical protein
MIRLSITAAAFDAISATLPLGYMANAEAHRRFSARRNH